MCLRAKECSDDKKASARGARLRANARRPCWCSCRAVALLARLLPARGRWARSGFWPGTEAEAARALVRPPRATWPCYSSAFCAAGMASPRTSRSCLTSSAETVSGGMMRSVSRCPVGSTSRPRSKHWRETSEAKPLPVASRSNSTATISPSPRTSAIGDSARQPSWRRPPISCSPRTRALSMTFSCSNTSSVASAAAQATAFPP
mmetsp:Transcript_71559/g.186522  ORF Transcript_71559/g.186522 Transcript_71559/m.186522 type:complete len:205 (+) Transcript_71559:136-750(+)